MKHGLKVALFYIALIGVIVIATALLWGNSSSDEIYYSDIVTYFKNEQVKRFVVDEKNNVNLVIRTVLPNGSEDEKTVSYKLRDIGIFYNDLNETILDQYERGIIEKYDLPAPAEIPWWVGYIPTLLVIIVFVVIWIYFMNQTAGKTGSRIGSFGKARVRMASNDKKKVLFKDVAGADEEKAELVEIVDFLKNPAEFTKLGAKIPHGVLLVGPPGTGKTLLAKAVAGEAGVPFFSISGSDFVEMYVGVGASRVRDLFDNARKNPAAIVFIDEIDAVGRRRGAGLGGGHDEKEQTLNQLLVEMDGFDSNEGVIVIAATNRPDILDPALLRPGRFDRQITVGYPDMKGREEILKVHARNKPLENTVDFTKIAQTTVGFTGAELANLLNEAALLAARRKKSLIGMDEIEDSYMKVLLGPQKKNKIRTQEDNRLCAYHESGHAIAAYFSEKADPVKHITIIPAGQTGGVTLMVPEKDRMGMSKRQMFSEIVVSLGGRVAEALMLDDISTGASNDIMQATRVARNMVTRYGMSDKLGPILYGSEHSEDEVFLGRDFSSGQNYSAKTAAEIDDEIRDIINRAYSTCEAILEGHKDKLEFLAEYLLKVESVDGDQFKAIMEGNPTFEELDAMVEEKKRKSDEENKARAEADREAAEKMAAERNAQAENGTDGGNGSDGNDQFGGYRF